MKKYELQLEEKEVSINLQGKLSLYVDSSLFTQVIDNLLSNAVKYSAPNSTIYITLEQDFIGFKNHCLENLSDIASKLCEPFIVSDSSRGNKTGTGLGLAIVKNICYLHKFLFTIHYDDGLFAAIIQIHKS